ncbi:uncharacterized protein LOC135693605 [Rhopilema esculentum]|uniref:uncharacterized protein LOC135693605 n=1 Tax=Rhopilema esculentum TaxID=499914 RepID=UPI0031E3B76B
MEKDEAGADQEHDNIEVSDVDKNPAENDKSKGITEGGPKLSVRNNINSKRVRNETIRKRVTTDVPIINCKKKKKISSNPKNDNESPIQERSRQNANISDIGPLPREEKTKNFKCDKCGSPFITNPMVRGNKVKKSKVLPSPRHKLDPETKKILSLCNACGLAFNRTKKAKKSIAQPSLEEKQKYFDEGKKYAENLVKELDNEEARRLYCTYFTKKPCGCIQKFIGDVFNVCSSETDESLGRAKDLLEVTLKAREYKSMKICVNENVTNGHVDSNENESSNLQKRQRKRSKRSTVGLGNGQKKSKQFESFVLDQRSRLKVKYGFCETGTKRVLLYSNNFLHKRLKTDPDQSCRVVRQKGKIALGKLSSIEDLPKEQCCVDNCVRMAYTHQTLLQEWRDRSTKGQAEARRVIAEMLTPSGGSRTNCHKFVSWVTGRSLTTIGKVNDQMKKTGGNREPPEHGLKKWWKNNPKPKKKKPEAKITTKSCAPAFNQDSTTPIITPFMQPLNILQTAANTSGLAAVIQPQQQQNQSTGSALSNNGPVITIPQSLIIQTGNGNSFAIPMSALQPQNWQLQQQLQPWHLLQLQQQQQHQQNAPAVAVALNPIATITRQEATAPTMVSNGNSQPNTFLIAAAAAAATQNIMDTSNELTPMLSTHQHTTNASTSQQQQTTTQFLQIAPANQSPSSILQNGLTLLNIAQQLPSAALANAGTYSMASPANLSAASSASLNVPSTGSLNVSSSANVNLISSGLPVMSQVSSSTEHLLPNEGALAILNSGNIGQLQGAQLTQLNPQSTNTQMVVNSPIQVSYISGT